MALMRPGRGGRGRVKPEMGLGGKNQHFLFYTPCVKNASFSRYSIVLFYYIPVQELSRIRESRLRSASSPRFARLRSQ